MFGQSRDPHHYAFFFLVSLARPLARTSRATLRIILSATGSGTSEMRSHSSACGQYGVHRGSYPMHRTAARAYVSGDGVKKEGLLMDAIFVATNSGTCTRVRPYVEIDQRQLVHED